MLYPVAGNSACHEGRNRDGVHVSAWGCGIAGSAWRKFQNVHVTERISAPCHSIVAFSLLIVYELFTKWHDNFAVTSRDTLVKILLNISKFSPRHGTHYFAGPASPRTLYLTWHAKLGAMA